MLYRGILKKAGSNSPVYLFTTLFKILIAKLKKHYVNLLFCLEPPISNGYGY